ncbi:MAG: lamin tail domain-containing protein, partial [Bacteroidota bacterium]
MKIVFVVGIILMVYSRIMLFGQVQEYNNPTVDMMTGIDTLGISNAKGNNGFRSWDLVINELMALNQTTYSDEAGDYDDWIELYNYGTDTIDLSGVYLTDDPANLAKFQIDSAIKIFPGSFVILWADDDTLISKYHLGFKLESDGGYIGISTSSIQLISYIVYGNQVVDVSYGRNTDGSSIWNYFNVATPNSSNSASVGLINIADDPVVDISGGFFSDSVI